MGGLAYAPADFCSTDYAPWLAADGGVLQVAVASVTHSDQATQPPNGACPDVGHGYTFHLLLRAPFAGSTVHDLTGRTLWVRAPTGLVQPASLPAGWQLRWSGDVPSAEPPLWVRVYAPATSYVTTTAAAASLSCTRHSARRPRLAAAPNGAPSGSGQATRSFFASGRLGKCSCSGSLELTASRSFGNEADLTLEQMLAIARSVKLTR